MCTVTCNERSFLLLSSKQRKMSFFRTGVEKALFVFLAGKSEFIRKGWCLAVAFPYKALGAAFGTTLYSDVQGSWKLHYALLRPVEGPGAMVTAGKVLTTFNPIWNIFCGQTYSAQLFQAIRAHGTQCHVMKVTLVSPLIWPQSLWS